MTCRVLSYRFLEKSGNKWSSLYLTGLPSPGKLGYFSVISTKKSGRRWGVGYIGANKIVKAKLNVFSATFTCTYFVTFFSNLQWRSAIGAKHSKRLPYFLKFKKHISSFSLKKQTNFFSSFYFKKSHMNKLIKLIFRFFCVTVTVPLRFLTNRS